MSDALETTKGALNTKLFGGLITVGCLAGLVIVGVTTYYVTKKRLEKKCEEEIEKICGPVIPPPPTPSQVPRSRVPRR